MTHRRFNTILRVLQYTSIDNRPATYLDRFWEVRGLVEAWNNMMTENFTPSWVNCLDESMSIWSNKYTCPGFMFVPRKPHPFGNEYHSVCCCLSGIMWQIELVEGKDRPPNLPKKKWDNLGATVGLLLRMLQPIFLKGFLVILDSGFCVLKGIIELKKNGVYASALIKKRRYWPAHIRGDDIAAHFEGKEVGATDSWPGRLDNENFHVYSMKEPEYVMSLMSTYGANTRIGDTTKRQWRASKNSPTQTASFQYPMVIHNHYKFRHSVDDHNGRRHSPIGLEVVWATKRWPNRCFSFLFALAEVNTNLAAAHFFGHEKTDQLTFRKQLAKSLIYNDFLATVDDTPKKKKRRAQESEHRLCALPAWKKFLGATITSAQSKYPQRKCGLCHKKKVRTYCACSPGIHMCQACYQTHVIDAALPLSS